MELRTYRAATMHEALAMVRRDLGPDAAVLHTREVRARRLFGWLRGPRQIEVTASCQVNVPSRLPAAAADRAAVRGNALLAGAGVACRGGVAVAVGCEPEPALTGEVQGQLSELQAMVNAAVPPLQRRRPRPTCPRNCSASSPTCSTPI